MSSKPLTSLGSIGPRIWVAAFGKHPGWNDHIDDQGLETDRLAAVRRQLYIEGVGGNVDAGTWDALEPDHRTEGFDHEFVWRVPEGVVAGRLWSSADGKGRSHYPMVVCAQCSSLPFAFIADRVMPRLAQLEAECRAARTAASVTALVDAARAELRAAVAKAEPVSRERLSPPGAAARLLDAGGASPNAGARGPGALDETGLARILYQLERDFSAFLRPSGVEGASRSRTVDVSARSMRVPRVSARVSEDLALYLRLFFQRVDPLTPLLLLAPPRDASGVGYIDVIAGEPNAAQLACLRQTPRRLPLASDVPYTIEPAFADRVRALVVEAREGRPDSREGRADSREGRADEHDPAYVNASSERLRALFAPVVTAPARPEHGAWPVAVAVLLAVLLVGAVVAGIKLFGPGAAGDSPPATPPAAEPAR